MTTFPPATTYRYVLKKGMIGHEVQALQILLNDLYKAGLVEDGHFGAITDGAVRKFQTLNNLIVDGVAGVVSQRKLALVAIAKAEAAVGLPVGLLRGLVEGESGFVVGAVSWSGDEGRYGVDCGLVQQRVWTRIGSTPVAVTAAQWREAFGLNSIVKAARAVRECAIRYHGKPGCPDWKSAWETAVLAHNWPAAADHIAAGTFNDWHYSAFNASGGRTTYGVDDRAYWVDKLGVVNVHTARQWAAYYIASKTVYVQAWPAA